jgi:hypothetical protein
MDAAVPKYSDKRSTVTLRRKRQAPLQKLLFDYLSACKGGPRKVEKLWAVHHLLENQTRNIRNTNRGSLVTSKFFFSECSPYVFPTEPNRLMLFGESVADYCENHTEHTDSLRGQNAEFEYVKADGSQSASKGQRVSQSLVHLGASRDSQIEQRFRSCTALAETRCVS